MIGATKAKLIHRKSSENDELIEYESNSNDCVLTNVTITMKDSDGVVERESYHLIAILKYLKPFKNDKLIIGNDSFVISKKQPLNTLKKGKYDWLIEADN